MVLERVPCITLFAVLAVSAPRAASGARDCSASGTDAYLETGVDAAFVEFERARLLAECAQDGQLAFNYARTLQTILERDGHDERVCLAAEAYAEAAGDASLLEPVRAIAARGEADFAQRCIDLQRAGAEPEEAAPIPPPLDVDRVDAARPSNAGAWLLTATAVAAIGGGAVSYVMADDALDSAEQARRRAQRAAGEPVDEGAYLAARRQYNASAETARRAEITAISLFGLGAALGAWALVVWLDDGEEAAIGLGFDGPTFRLIGEF